MLQIPSLSDKHSDVMHLVSDDETNSTKIISQHMLQISNHFWGDLSHMLYDEKAKFMRIIYISYNERTASEILLSCMKFHIFYTAQSRAYHKCYMTPNRVSHNCHGALCAPFHNAC